MYRKNSLLLLFTILSFALLSCGGNEPNEEVESDGDGIKVTVEDENGETQTVNIDLDQNDIDQLQNGLADALQDASNALRNADTEDVEIMGFRELKAVLPERLLGMDRTSHKGEKSGAMGFSISQAEAEYEEDDKSLSVQVVDAGKLGMMKAGMAAWATLEIDKESDDGFERTTTIDGHKAFEKYDSRSGDSELIFLYKDRYIITLNGNGLDDDDLRKALRRVDYEDLN